MRWSKVLFDLRVKDPGSFGAADLSEGEFDERTGRVLWEGPFTSRCVDDMLDWLEEVQSHLALEGG